MFRQRTPKTKRQRDVQSAKTNNGKIVTQTEVVDGAKGMKVERIGLLGGEGEGGGLKGDRQMQIPRYRYKRAQIQSNTYVNCFAASVVGVAKNEKLLFKIKSTFNFLVICCQPAQPQKEKGGG